MSNDGGYIKLDFIGCCADDNCLGEASRDGSLTFGSGAMIHEERRWEHPCEMCNTNWRRENGYLFDIAVAIQCDSICRKTNNYHSTIYLNQDQLTQLKKAFRFINFLLPFEGLIKKVVKVLSDLENFFTATDKIANSYKGKTLPGRNNSQFPR